MISESEARRIAGDWHGGQWSPLYAFCSSGTMVEGLEEEIGYCLSQCTDGYDKERLQDLKEYVDAHARES